MKNITVVGTGYVGLVTGACFADLGNRVCCLDINEERIENLNKNILPIYEPGLAEMVQRNVSGGRLSFTTSYAHALDGADFAFICVATPEGVDGEADLQYVRQAATSIARTMTAPLTIVNKSTVPVGTGDWVADIVRENQPEPIDFAVVSCPEFLREGAALADFMNPHRTVLGSFSQEATDRVAQLHLPLRAPIVVTDLRTAEMIKYASNAFLATKISFINEIANICEALGADIKEVAVGMGYDNRIGAHFLDAGIGYGGSCFLAEETIFALNSPNVATETFESLFLDTGKSFQGDTVQLTTPSDRRVLAFDLEANQPVLAELKAVTRRPYRGAMVKIKTSMGRALRVTADHPIVVHTEFGFDVLPAASIAPGDQLMALRNLPAVEQVTELNLVDLLRDHELEADVLVSSTDRSISKQYEQFAAHISREMLRHPHEIKRYNRMRLPIFRRLSELGVLKIPAEKLQLYTTKGAATKINAVIPVDTDLMRLCGYYLAGGFISEDSGRAGAVRQRIGFSFHEAEIEYIEDVQHILESWGLKFSERHSTSALTTIVSSRVFAWLLRDVLQCGARSEDKALPRVAFNVSAELRYELVRGAFSGDGAVTTVQSGKNLMYEYATVSKQLADGMALLLQSLGIVPSIQKRWKKKSTMPAYILRVSGYSQLDALKDVVGEKHREKIATVLAGYQRHIRQRGCSRRDSYVALTVRNVEYEDVETTVYSMETSTGTLIASSGLICHNCFPKDVKALAHMASVQGRHPQLLQSVMEINADARQKVIVKLRETLGDSLRDKVVGLLGLAFKPNTDDMRDAPAIEIAQSLLQKGAFVRCYDPVAMDNAQRTMNGVTFAEDPYDLATGCDALVVVTEWNEFKQLDLARVRAAMRGNVIIDGRNIYSAKTMHELDFVYRGVGRGYNHSEDAA